MVEAGACLHLNLFMFTQPLLGCYQWRNYWKRDVTALNVIGSTQDRRLDLFLSSFAVDLGGSINNIRVMH
jgi:hypothetical protein